MILEGPWGCWECVAGVHEATIDSACHLCTKVLTVWKMVPRARGRRAGSRGATFLRKLRASSPNLPCSSITKAVTQMPGYFLDFACAANMHAVPSLFPEPLLKASVDNADTMVTSMYMGVWPGMCTIKSILDSG